MRAILRKQFGGPDVLEIREIPDPEPKAGHAVIQVKAFGINHAEMHMRKGEWAEIADVSGIECVGLATARSSIRSRCSAGAVARVWRGGWAASPRSTTSTRSYRWQAVST
jgi:NADPH:quinone reductase-like Zn-dependent oxidoreductase